MASILPTNTEYTPTNQKTSINTSDNTIIITSGMEQPSVPSQAQLIQQVSGKHQVLPVVYIQAPPKISNNKTPNNVIFNTMPQIQIQNLPSMNNKNLNIAPNVGSQSLLIGKQPLILQKPPNFQSIPVAPKNGLAYLTMLKKPADTNVITTNRLPISAVNKIKHDQTIHMFTSTNSITNNQQKFVIAPMPKVTSNRLPITATTNSVQSKLSFMPITIPNIKKHKIINLKIADGQIQPESTPVTMCDTMPPEQEPQDEINKNLLCMEMLDLDSPEKNQEDQTYQISIIEDSNSTQEPGYTISINEDQDRNRIELKDTPKFSKHGVSILKKTYSFLDKKEKPVVSQGIFKSITTISDANTKEVKITSEQNEETPPQKKAERRRKSTICLRKEYDEVQEDRVLLESKIPKLEEQPTDVKSEEMEEDAKGKTEVDLESDDYDVAKLLEWEDGIGTLPGSDLKFQMNEFGFLEYLTKDEYRKMHYRKQMKQMKLKETEKKKSEMQEMRCLECGCYGMPSEFISPKYCSLDCQNACEKDVPLKIKKKKKQRGVYKRMENGEIKQESSDDDNTSNENSHDKYSYPWTCHKKGFSWTKYLDHVKAKGAPVKLFRDPFPYNRNGFRPGMKLEGIDPQHPSYFCVFTVAEVIGYRLRLHFDGYPDNYDFWVNADSMDIFPAGFCEKFGHILHPPPGYDKDFNWNFYLKYTRSPAAPKQLFANRPENAIFPNGFRTGMKLEAVDRKNTSLVCVATITDMMDNRILVHFDSWDDIYDYWADPTSPYIHPVGWCDQNGHNLTPPNDYPNPETFTWERYLKETKSVAAPVRAFKQRPTSGFKKGMRLECVDRRVPQLIRVATVDDVKDHQIRISFDGWPDRYSYYVDDDSMDIHPVGWSHKTGHPIEPPLTPDDVYDFLECATVGCKGQGHIRGPVFPTHTTQKNCPYAEENIDIEKIVPDRLLTPDRQIEAVVPVSREPRDKIKGRIGRPPKYPRIEPKPEPLWIIDEPLEEELPREVKVNKTESPPTPSILAVKKEDVLEEEVNTEEDKMREKHLKYLNRFIDTDVDPRDWNYDDVVNFVTSLPYCRHKGYLFLKNKIDGESLLMLTQQDLTEILNFKLGPAIMLYNCILILRKTVISCT